VCMLTTLFAVVWLVSLVGFKLGQGQCFYENNTYSTFVGTGRIRYRLSVVSRGVVCVRRDPNT